MSEVRLKALLGEVPVPDADRAEDRGLAVARAAFEERREETRRTVLPRLAIAFAAATLLAALLLSPAGAAVRDWIDDTFAVGVRDAEPALTDIPGGGRLLVQSANGPWIVQPDGSRRLLGDFGGAAWSPHGLFVAAIDDHALSAVAPDGTVRWSLSTERPVAGPRWSPSGFRIAYRAGDALRVVAGNGSGDALLARQIAPVAPVWLPLGPHLLVYVDAANRPRAINVDSGEVVASAGARAGIEALDWAPDGSQLLEATPRSLWLRDVESDKLGGELSFGSAKRFTFAPGTTIRSVSFSPRGETIAALLDHPARGARPARSEVVLVDVAGAPARPLFTAPGRLSDLTWSPDGNRLLIGWPEADQWLFVPVADAGRARAIGSISAEFAPGEDAASAPFPRIKGWCCAATVAPPPPPGRSP